MPQYHHPGGTVSYPDAKSLYPSVPRVSFGRAVAIGLSAGFLGALVMTGTNKIEQLITHRPNSFVPARTIGNHLGVSPSFYQRHTLFLNHLHRFGMGILAGPVRAIMSYYGVIGPFAAFVHTGVRIMMDQTVELTAGTSAVPWSWPINEQVIDVLHKGVYAIVTGYVCDRLVRGVDWFNRS
ncbi:hypothetical protein COCMIDRAFT_95988 [Bipolaris oryzae ATCC 44560]|uniref:DUF1440 domain-containing protein n=1 Tax=Bipolaris oryzae ATCC 44560 TaxID=930090 RepID=W6ZCX4_COCMI|nr:uncharacterized protein COCMIDRAFT_95988 [Bipolaris oryzae ATCC 44560]EUC45269.1 hypothetical protein COCMIDRAFT_95988 [Bipolaris oryzae ATCC 44560]